MYCYLIGVRMGCTCSHAYLGTQHHAQFSLNPTRMLIGPIILMHICTYMHMHSYVYTYIHTHIHMHTYIHLCILTIPLQPQAQMTILHVRMLWVGNSFIKVVTLCNVPFERFLEHRILYPLCKYIILAQKEVV